MTGMSCRSRVEWRALVREMGGQKGMFDTVFGGLGGGGGR